jgi:hypothetical protein
VAVFFVNKAAKPKEKSKLHARFISINLVVGFGLIVIDSYKIDLTLRKPTKI